LLLCVSIILFFLVKQPNQIAIINTPIEDYSNVPEWNADVQNTSPYTLGSRVKMTDTTEVRIYECIIQSIIGAGPYGGFIEGNPGAISYWRLIATLAL